MKKTAPSGAAVASGGRAKHGDWEKMGDLGVEARAGYTEGWEPVLDLFVAAAR